MRFIMISGLFLLSINALGSPFTITNDTSKEIFITDGNMHAIHVGPGQAGTIDPTIHGKILGLIPNSWFFKEELHVYRQLEDPNTFYKHYLLTEKYCSNDSQENQLKISDIETLPESLTKRFHVVTYPMPPEPFVIPSKH